MPSRRRILWSIAHQQGFKLPVTNYFEFVDTDHRLARQVGEPRRLPEDHAHLDREASSRRPAAIERSVYEVIGKEYRGSHVTQMELRFNPMKRNLHSELDLDHIISAAIRGMDRAVLEYGVKPGLIFCLDRAFPFELNEIIVEKAIAWRDRGVVGVDIAGPESSTFRVADYRRLFRRARQFGLGVTVHTGEIRARR